MDEDNLKVRVISLSGKHLIKILTNKIIAEPMSTELRHCFNKGKVRRFIREAKSIEGVVEIEFCGESDFQVSVGGSKAKRKIAAEVIAILEQIYNGARASTSAGELVTISRSDLPTFINPKEYSLRPVKAECEE